MTLQQRALVKTVVIMLGVLAALAIASKQGNTVLLGGGAQPLINVGK